MDNSHDERADDERQLPPEPGEAEEGREGADAEQPGFHLEDLNAPLEGNDRPEAGEPGGEPAASDSPAVAPDFDADVPEPQAQSRPPRAATYVAFGIVVLAVLGVLMSITSVRLYLERANMAETLTASIDRLAVVYARPGASDASKRRVAWLKRSLDDGDYSQARKAIEALGSPKTPPEPEGELQPEQVLGEPGRPGERLPPPSADRNLAPAAQQFFAAHQELWRGFFGFSAATQRAERAGADVEDLKQLRKSIISAAEAGDAEGVESLLGEAREAVDARSDEQIPDTLEQKLQEFGAAFKKAREERRDVRKAARLAQQSEQAARQGRFKRAEELIDQATDALEEAPRMRPQGPPRQGRGPRGAPRPGPEAGFFRFVAELTSKVMKMEERDLTQIWDSINIAAGAIREKNAEQIREILGEARDALHDIGDRRRTMSATIQQAQEQVRSRRAPDEREERAEQQEERMEALMARIGDILAQVREMPEDQFRANRRAVVRQLLAALRAPAGPSPAEEMTPEERVRAKIPLAGEMYLRFKRKADAETPELDALFEQARELIIEHRYEEAEELVDSGVGRMRSTMGGEGDGPPGDDTLPPPPKPLEEQPHLDLRGIGADEPIVAPPPAVGEDTQLNLNTDLETEMLNREREQ
ncbi:MAG: hypothetical protein U9R79_17190 [Armatimonadota bacterium]|nr:hypothetical protein [Armatimonadota bacterium]